ncbi:hypothetical protein BDM02DRAFT_3061437, partial [Thelephora ganbajun]
SGWDPVLLISQIVSVQTIHYLALSVLIPPLLSLFAEPNSLNYEGGATNVGVVMDWREMAGRPTVQGWNREDRWDVYGGAWSGGRKFDHKGFEGQQWSGIDPIRGWIIAFCWLMASCADVYTLYFLVRRPRLILDFALTLIFNHLVLTTYYSSSVPTSLFFWAVLLAGCTGTVIVTEQLCVKREMNEGLVVPADNALEDIEIGVLRRD